MTTTPSVYDGKTVVVGEYTIDVSSRYDEAESPLLGLLVDAALNLETADAILYAALQQAQYNIERAMQNVRAGLHVSEQYRGDDITAAATRREALARQLRQLAYLVKHSHPELVTTTTED